MTNEKVGLLSDDELLDWIADSTAEILRISNETGKDAPIATINDWKMWDLVSHVGHGFAGWFTFNITLPPGDANPATALFSAPKLPPTYEGRQRYLVDWSESFCDLARRQDLDGERWAFWMTRPARFWIHRAATETAVHEFDAATATGGHRRLSPRASATSIDETLRGFWPGVLNMRDHGATRHRFDTPDGSISIVATDSDRSWTVQRAGDTVEVTDGDGAPTVIGGEGTDLVMWLWGRQPERPLDLDGERDAIESWNLVRLSGI